MTGVWEVIGATSGIAVPLLTVGIAAIRSRFAAKDRKIELLTQANENLKEVNQQLKLDNRDLKIVGQVMNRFLNQLPPSDEIHKEKS